MNYENGTKAFIIESNRCIREVTVTRRSGDFYIVRFTDGTGGIQVRSSRLFPSREEAEAAVLGRKQEQKAGYRSPYDYWH